MNRIQTLALAAVLAAPAAAMAQAHYVERTVTSSPYYGERITVYEHPLYQSFVIREGGALQSGGNNLDDTLLADSVAMAIARDPALDGATVTVAANGGNVSVVGSANHEQSERARQIARRVAGNASGELSNTGG
jgi:osmotically-inducible protein OsmY